jgi:CRISPR-associated endonuclease/helicase Cas3
MKFLANTNGQDLVKHLKAIAYSSMKIYEKLNFDDEGCRIACFMAGLLHDIGKVDPKFQEFIKKQIDIRNGLGKGKIIESIEDSISEKSDEWEKFVRHNEISWLITTNVAQRNNEKGKPCLISGRSAITSFILYTIYWHHKEINRNDKSMTEKDLKKFLGNRWKTIIESIKGLLVELASFAKKILKEEMFCEIDSELKGNERTIDFKELKTSNDSHSTAIRICVVEADRTISKLSAKQLDNLFTDDGQLNEESIEELLKEGKK